MQRERIFETFIQNIVLHVHDYLNRDSLFELLVQWRLMMKKLIMVFLVLSAMCPMVLGDETQQLLQKVVDKANGSIAIIRWTEKDEISSKSKAGIGICIDKQGWFMIPSITAKARAETIQDIEIILAGPEQKSIKAKLLGIDPVTGMSFIQAEESHSWNSIAFVRNSELKLGSQVVSCGINPVDPQSGLELGTGYVSSISFTPRKQIKVTGGSLGVYGSVVFDSKLRPVGIVTAQSFQQYQVVLQGRTAPMQLRSESQSQTFTPTEEFVQILSKIPQDGKIAKRPWIGVGGFTPLSKELAEVKGITTPAVRLDQVIPGEAAANAGLKNGDIIVSVNGKALKNFGNPRLVAAEFNRSMMRLPIGTEITLGVLENGNQRAVKVKLQATPTLPSHAKRSFDEKVGMLVREKVMLDRHLGKDPSAGTDGLLVLGVGQKSPAGQGGVKQGDLLTKINGHPVQTVKQFEDILDKALSQKSDSSISFVVQRGADEKELTITLPK